MSFDPFTTNLTINPRLRRSLPLIGCILAGITVALVAGYYRSPEPLHERVVEKIVEKPVEVIKYVPVPNPPPVVEQIPFGMSQEQAWKYKNAPDIVVTYVLMGQNHTTKPQAAIEWRWPNFGKVVSERNLGSVINDDLLVIEVTVQKFDCWKQN